MQKSFDINSSTGTYAVQIDTNILQKIIKQDKNSLFIIDKELKQYISSHIEKIIYLEANEKNKSLECIPKYIEKMKNYNLNRNSHIYGIGGGVIQDIATFSSSIYMRGISWSYFPSTLLGMVDSCIGGKSAINLKDKKNLVGNFFPPKNIFVDLQFIKTLPSDHVMGGIFEASKICFAKGQTEFDRFLSTIGNSSVYRSNNMLNEINFFSMIELSLESKKWFIENDEFDQKERLLLNFGHTFGHAFETATNFKISHGISVGWGMAVAIEVARNLNLLNDDGFKHANKMNNFLESAFLNLKDMQEIKIPDFDYDIYMKAFKNDKKHLDNKYRVILPFDHGKLKLISLDKSIELENILINATRKYIKEFNFIK